MTFVSTKYGKFRYCTPLFAQNIWPTKTKFHNPKDIGLIIGNVILFLICLCFWKWQLVEKKLHPDDILTSWYCMVVIKMPSWFDEFFFDLFVCWNHNYLGVALCCCWLFFAAFLFKTCLAFSRLISSSVMSSLMISWTKKSSSLSPREIKLRLWRFSLHKSTQGLFLQKKLNVAKYFSDIFHSVGKNWASF